MRIRELHFGTGDLIVADTLLCISNTYKATDSMKNAIKNIKASISIREELMPPYDIMSESFIGELHTVSDEVIGQLKTLLDCYELYATCLEGMEEESDESNLREAMGDVFSSIHDWDNATTRYAHLWFPFFFY